MIDWWVAALAVLVVAALLGFELWRSEQRVAATQAAFERECESYHIALERASVLSFVLELAHEALEDCADHTSVCWRGMEQGERCVCGLADALTAARAALEGPYEAR